MSEPNQAPDAIEQANESFWTARQLDELMVDVAPLSADEDFSIDDLTESEWALFVDALNE